MEDRLKQIEKKLDILDTKLNNIIKTIGFIIQNSSTQKEKKKSKSISKHTTSYEIHQREKRWRKDGYLHDFKIPKIIQEETKNQQISNFRGANIIESDINSLKEIEIFIGKNFNYEHESEYNPKMSFRVVKNRVTILGLNDCDISSLPEQIGNLRALQILTLSNNMLTILPEGLSKLRFLKELYLEGNNLISLPENIGNLKNLEYLNLDNNKLTSLPENIGNLKSLEIIRINNNNLEKLPNMIGNLKNLIEAHLNQNILKELPKSIENLIKVEVLSLNNNRLVSLPEEIGKMQELTSLSLLNNNLNTLPTSIKILGRLQYLWIRGNPLFEKASDSKSKKIIEFLKKGGVKI